MVTVVEEKTRALKFNPDKVKLKMEQPKDLVPEKDEV